MKLVRFTGPNHDVPTLGVTDGIRVSAIDHIAPDCRGDMSALIASWDRHSRAVAALKPDTWGIGDVRLYAPVARPGKIFAIGLNYADHAAEGMRRSGLPIRR